MPDYNINSLIEDYDISKEELSVHFEDLKVKVPESGKLSKKVFQDTLSSFGKTEITESVPEQTQVMKLEDIKSNVELPKNKDGKKVDQDILGVLTRRGGTTTVKLSRLIENPLLTLKSYPTLHSLTNLSEVDENSRNKLLAEIASKSKKELSK